MLTESINNITMVTGIIGCLTGLFALWRENRLERKLDWERYLRGKWININGNLSKHIARARELVQKIDDNLSSEYPEHLDVFNLETYTQHKQINWSYNKKFSTNINKLNVNTQKLIDLSEKYNYLRHFTTNSYALYRMMCDTGIIDSFIEQDKKEREEERREEERNNLLKILDDCREKPEHTLGELRENPRYKSKLSKKLKEFRATQCKLYKILGYLENTTDKYNTIFKPEPDKDSNNQ